MEKNVCKRYGITDAELQQGVEQYSKLATGKFAGETTVLLAILDLLINGDIPAPDPGAKKQILSSAYGKMA